jgi:hypothetical protein
VDQLEGLVKDDVFESLNPAIAFNLCTLYDLFCGTKDASERKRALKSALDHGAARRAFQFPTGSAAAAKSFRL